MNSHHIRVFGIAIVAVLLPTTFIGQTKSLGTYQKEIIKFNKSLPSFTSDGIILRAELVDSKFCLLCRVEDDVKNIKNNYNDLRKTIIEKLWENDSITTQDFSIYNINYLFIYKARDGNISVNVSPEEVIGYHFYKLANNTKDIFKRVSLYEKAAEYGNVESIEILAYYYENGYVVKQDFTKAYKYYTYLIEHKDDVIDWYHHVAKGYSNASSNPYLLHLANFLLYGKGCQQDESLAISYFEQLASNDDVPSMYQIAKFFFDKKNYEQAISWFEKISSKQLFFSSSIEHITYGESIRMLSSCYRYGLGVDTNQIIADSLMKRSQEFYNKQSYSISNEESIPSPNFTPQKIEIDMVYVNGGTFQMGATQEQQKDLSPYYYSEDCSWDIVPESFCYPVINVMLDDFRIAKHEVTQKEWYSVMGYNNSLTKGDDLPVHNISWFEAVEFIKKLNDLTGKNYRLPTEAEWEYAARGGEKSENYIFVGSNDWREVAWTKNESKDVVHPVCTKKANELGLYDMAGNVFEWCQDWMGGYGIYSENVIKNPHGPSDNEANSTLSYCGSKVIRGGSVSHFFGSNVSWRWMEFPARRCKNGGFRLCESVK